MACYIISIEGPYALYVHAVKAETRQEAAKKFYEKVIAETDPDYKVWTLSQIEERLEEITEELWTDSYVE